MVYHQHADYIFLHFKYKTIMSLLTRESKEVRNRLVKVIYKQPWDNELRTSIDSLLIMYDQYVQFFEKHPEYEKDF